jgi:hypothetical protein
MHDDDTDALALAMEAKARRSRRRRRRSARKHARTWWPSTARRGAAAETATRPAPSPDGPEGAPDLTLEEFIAGM